LNRKAQRERQKILRDRLALLGRLAVCLQAGLIPLVCSPFQQSAYILPKTSAALWISSAVLLSLLAGRWMLDRQWKDFRSPLDLPILVLAGWMLLSSFFSLRFAPAAERLLLYFSAWVTWKAASVFFSKPDERAFGMGVQVLAAVGVCLVVWQEIYSGMRFPPGTMGNANFNAQFLIIPFCLLAPFFLRTLISRERFGRWRWTLGALLAVLGGTLYLLKSEGAMLGVLVGLSVVSFGFHFRNRWNRLITRGQSILLILFFLLLGLAVVIQLFTKNTSMNDLAGRVLAEESVQVRLQIWLGGLEMIQDNAVLGVGPGNFAIEYPTYRREEETRVYARKSTIAHAHNTYIEWLAELGIPGLLLLFWALFRLTGRMMRLLSEEDGRNWYWCLGVLAALTATDAHGFFSSNIFQPAPVISLAFLLGMLERVLPWSAEPIIQLEEVQEEASSIEPEPERAQIERKAQVSWNLVIVMIIGVFLVSQGLLYFHVYRPLVADAKVRSAIRARNRMQLAQAAASFEQASNLDAWNYDSRHYRSILALETNRPEDALYWANKALELRPYEFDDLFIRGLAKERLGDMEEAGQIHQGVLDLFPPHPEAQQALDRLEEKES